MFPSVQVVIKDKRAVSVEFIKDGRKHVIKAKREVILSAGTVGSAQILLLSGVGPKSQLQKLNVSILEAHCWIPNLVTILMGWYSILHTR